MISICPRYLRYVCWPRDTERTKTSDDHDKRRKRKQKNKQNTRRLVFYESGRRMRVGRFNYDDPYSCFEKGCPNKAKSVHDNPER